MGQKLSTPFLLYLISSRADLGLQDYGLSKVLLLLQITIQLWLQNQTKPSKPTGEHNRLNSTTNKSTEFSGTIHQRHLWNAHYSLRNMTEATEGVKNIINVQQGKLIPSTLLCGVLQTTNDQGSGSPMVLPVLKVNVGEFLFY